MGWPHCNTTIEHEKLTEVKVWHGMTFHHFGLILSAFFGLFAILMSWYLIWRHCTHYLKPWEQRQIIRVLFMVPIYASVSFLSYYFYQHAVYFEVIRDCYEAFAIASFFSLLCHYVAPDLHSQKDFFRSLHPIKQWVLPVSWFRKCSGGEHGKLRVPRSGLTWFNLIWFGVYQYCFIRVFMTMVAVIAEAAGRYCLESLNPAFAHIWVMVVEGGCVSIAMYCLIQFYWQLKGDLVEHQPLLKVAAIKLVIFLSFWQTIIISFLTSSGAIKSSPRIQTPDIKIGIPSLLLCIEMAIFSVFHLWAFPWKVYDIRRSHIVASESAPGFLPDPKTAYQGGPFGIKAIMDAFNPWDLVKAVGRGFRWAAVGRKRRMEDVSYINHTQGTSLEPTRNQLTAFNTAGQSFEIPQGSASNGTVPGGKPGRYQSLSDEDDEDRLFTKAQSNPKGASQYPRPMERLPHLNAPVSVLATGDAEISGGYDPPPPSYANTKIQDSRHLAPQDLSHSRSNSLESQDTSYNGARLSPAIPPDSHPLGPTGRKSHEQQEWDMWGGAGRGENERDLGGGHGVGDNRF